MLRGAERLPSIRDKTIVRAGKGHDGGKPRTIPANAELRRTLTEYNRSAGRCPVPAPARRCSSTGYGQRLSVRAVDQLVADLGTRSAWMTSPHVLRHSFATDMLRAGGTLQAHNRGGEDHTFTEVASFGGGCIAALNDLLG